jgi:hypothetical protein
VRAKQALLFLKKKKQKNFYMLGLRGLDSAVQCFVFAGERLKGGAETGFNTHSLAKAFWFSFSKKETFYSFGFTP